MGGEEGQTIEFYSPKETIVFWSIDDYPVPNNTDVQPLKAKIKFALAVMGFDGYPLITLYSEKLKYDLKVLSDTGRVVYLPKCPQAYKHKLDLDVTYYMLMHLEHIGRTHSNVAVISKKPSDELLRVLGCLKSRGHTALLIQPPHDDVDVFTVDSLVLNAQLLGGGKPLHKDVITPEDLRQAEDDCSPSSFINEEEDYTSPATEMIDFSERAKHVKGERTVIFWDALDCPFPLCFSSSPDHIFNRIRFVVNEMGGLSDNISIWAYVDKDSELLMREKNTWASKIYFLPGEKKGSSRRIRMLNDMLLLSRDSPPRYPDEAGLILVSGQFKGVRPYINAFKTLESRHYYLVLVTPSMQPEEPVGWPGLLMSEAYHLLT